MYWARNCINNLKGIPSKPNWILDFLRNTNFDCITSSAIILLQEEEEKNEVRKERERGWVGGGEMLPHLQRQLREYLFQAHH